MIIPSCVCSLRVYALVGRLLWVGRCELAAVGRSSGLFIRGRSLWVNRCELVAVGRSSWFGCCRSVVVGQSLEAYRCGSVVLGRSLWVGRCGSVVVGRSSWVSVGRCGQSLCLVAAGRLLTYELFAIVDRFMFAARASLYGQLLWVSHCGRSCACFIPKRERERDLSFIRERERESFI